MFCFQCEQRGPNGCVTSHGVCGKESTTAVLQDVLIYSLKGLSIYAHELRKRDIIIEKYDLFALKALFTTVTNVNFSSDKVRDLIKECFELRNDAEHKIKELNIEIDKNKYGSPSVLDFEYTDSIDTLVSFEKIVGIQRRRDELGKDIAGTQELVLYGLKGLAAYADHAYLLNYKDSDIMAFVHEAMTFLSEQHSLEEILGMALKVGEYNLKTMELLDKAHTDTFGNPVPTQVRITPVKGKAILISGHDLVDLKALLEQTEGKGINIYTHGEMLPAHGYPELKKYKHLVGNYGGAWQNQHSEFDKFPGSILMTTNCIQKPANSYMDRIFTTGLVAFPNVKHIPDRDYTELINKALECEGFLQDEEEKNILVGFGHNAVLSVADKVIDGVKAGAIKHFFLIGGCDGAKPGRNYFTEFAQSVPDDCVVLTLACGKYRFNKLEFGDIGGIPRLLDVGQCNDAYSAIKIASALANAFNTDVNSLPLSLIISWYEQKAVAVLLSLLHLGIKNIHLGPTLPAFVEPNVLNILVENFAIKPTSTAEHDLKAILNW